jgi:hypothetical protein
MDLFSNLVISILIISVKFASFITSFIHLLHIHIINLLLFYSIFYSSYEFFYYIFYLIFYIIIVSFILILMSISMIISSFLFYYLVYFIMMNPIFPLSKFILNTIYSSQLSYLFYLDYYKEDFDFDMDIP